jgi:hypothetical protein
VEIGDGSDDSRSRAPLPVNTEHALQLNDDTQILRQWLSEASETD